MRGVIEGDRDDGSDSLTEAPGGPRVLVLADDLIWASRLIEAVRRAGAAPLRLGSEGELLVALGAAEADEGSAPTLTGAVVDLNGRRYTGLHAVERIHEAGLPVIAVAQHDDLVTRRSALAAGAARVFSYNKFFSDGPRLVAAWLQPSQTSP
jgi:CheY-like chemotaxis protein